MAASPDLSCGWYGSLSDVLLLPKAYWLAAMQEHHRHATHRPAGKKQLSAWDRQFGRLAKELKQLLQVKPAVGNWTIIFGYDWPRWRVKGPDAILLGPAIFVVEFVDEDNYRVLQIRVEELAAIAHDLEQYHAGSRHATVVPLLLLGGTTGLIRREGDVIALSPDCLADVLVVESELESGPRIDPLQWIAAGNSPHPPSSPPPGT